MPESTTEITLVHSPGCHLCAEARAALEDLGSRHRLTVKLVDARSPEGLALVARHRPALQPLVLVDGEAFSAGRLPRRKLDRYLNALRDEAAS